MEQACRNIKNSARLFPHGAVRHIPGDSGVIKLFCKTSGIFGGLGMNTYATVHHSDPDYSRPLLEIPHQYHERFKKHLQVLYGPEVAAQTLPELERVLKVYYAHKPKQMIEEEKDLDPINRFTEKDLVLITYGDMVEGSEGHPLMTLSNLVQEHLYAFNTLHILPFFPFSSDRGFSVVDFKQVDSRLGNWEDIWNLDSSYQLMFDGVVNHISAQSKAFRNFINGVPGSEDLFIVFNSQDDLTTKDRQQIFRPRTSDVLSEFQTINGPKFVWTTFSRDQVDLNYHSPKVLLYVLNLLLFYVRQGADIIRLDAVTYLWSEPGTSCVHLKQTHEIVKLMRDVLNLVAPRAALITETNVPHNENISYFGDGYDEAQMVYNFALPPLVLHAFYREDASYLSDWAASLSTPSDQTAFFNMLDTHDGIGLMGATGILPPAELEYMVAEARERGARISYCTTSSHDKQPYEINSTWFDALNGKARESTVFQVKRHVASRSIPLMLKGVPAVYLHGALGTGNDKQAVEKSGVRRDINRSKINLDDIRIELKKPGSKLNLLRHSLARLGMLRINEPAFHPQGGQEVLSITEQAVSILRTSLDNSRRVLALTNVTPRMCPLEINLAEHGLERYPNWRCLVSGNEWYSEDGVLELALSPYEVSWLIPLNQKSAV
jgi:glycosidase